MCCFSLTTPTTSSLSLSLPSSPPSLPPCLPFLQEGDASYRSGVPVVPVGLLLHLPTQSSAIKCNANSWIVSGKKKQKQTLANKTKQATLKKKKKKKEKKNNEKRNNRTTATSKKKEKKNQSGNGCTYLFLEPKMKRKEKHLWQFSFPFLCFHFGTFCPFSSRFFSVA